MRKMSMPFRYLFVFITNRVSHRSGIGPTMRQPELIPGKLKPHPAAGKATASASSSSQSLSLSALQAATSSAFRTLRQ